MIFNVFFNLKNRLANKEVKMVPNSRNPVEAENMKALLHMLADNLPETLVAVTGVTVVEVDDEGQRACSTSPD
jgi:hypothetical protein